MIKDQSPISKTLQPSSSNPKSQNSEISEYQSQMESPLTFEPVKGGVR